MCVILDNNGQSMLETQMNERADMRQAACDSIESIPPTTIELGPALQRYVDGHVVKHIRPLPACSQYVAQNNAKGDAQVKQ